VTESIEEIASRWLARLDREDASEEDRASFEAWRNADPRHAAAYAHLEAICNRILRIPELRARPGGGAPKAFVRASTRGSGNRVYSRAAAAAAAACLVIGTIALFLWSRHDDLDTSQRIATEVGGYQKAPLPDGSVVELNTDTELRTSITAMSRYVELLRGEATFEVVHDPRRPFIVTAGGTAVRAVGTVFNVRRREDTVEILIVEGKVAVGPTAAALRSETTSMQTTPVIRAGQAAVAARSGLEVRAVSSEEMERELAWQQGMLSFGNSTLAEAAAEFNRYNSRQLVISDSSLAEARVAGYFRANNVDGFVRVLESEFAIRATHERGRIILTAASVSDTHPTARSD
jgi:transmembrane sensor